MMETKIVKIDPVKIDTAEIEEAAQVVDGGGLVAFPTETVYGIACRVETKSLAKLDSIKGRGPDKYYTLHISEKTDVEKYVPTIGLMTKKLIKNCWPGPLTIVFELTESDIKKQRKNLKEEVFENLYKDNSIGIRCPDNAVAAMLLQKTEHPVVAPSANKTGQPPATDAEQVLAQFSGQIDLLLDGGPCKYKKSSTVVKIDKKGLEILRVGVYSQEELKAMSEVKFLFVCTGNTCRSPMAKGIFSKNLAEKLQCKVDQLDKIGYKVSSAGVMNMTGQPASAEAIAACAAKGIDIRAHKSKTLTRQLVEESDFIFAMMRMHCERVIALCPVAADKCVLLGGNKEIPDPIGQPQEVFNDCAELIEETVRERISELVI
jgi:L-threonylcarbamoyladenylate synthase